MRPVSLNHRPALTIFVGKTAVGDFTSSLHLGAGLPSNVSSSPSSARQRLSVKGHSSRLGYFPFPGGNPLRNRKQRAPPLIRNRSSAPLYGSFSGFVSSPPSSKLFRGRCPGNSVLEGHKRLPSLRFSSAPAPGTWPPRGAVSAPSRLLRRLPATAV